MTCAKRETRVTEVKAFEERTVIVLEMSVEEARTMRAITAAVAGHTAGPRRHADSIGNALNDVVGYWRDVPEYLLMSGYISFKGYPETPEPAPVRVPRVFTVGDTIPADVKTVNDGDDFASIWNRESDGWRNVAIGTLWETTDTLLCDYDSVTEVL